ncbi:MAG: 7TM diverse intracellular signaling domain-containing protein [Mariprofundaceae bacterium]|nr:7TM diverse intracellular signaling domain-containing protein [Mariprofundaceae bacterium]
MLLCPLAIASNDHAIEKYQVHEAMFTADAVDVHLTPQHEEPYSSSWHRITLPHNWDNADYIYHRDGWYHFHYTSGDPLTRQHAIYLPRLNMNTAVYINGELLNNGGDFKEPMARNWNRPLLFIIPEAMLHGGVNHIVIHVKAYLNSGGGLGYVYIGPASVLKGDYRWHYRTFISTTIVSCSITVALGLAMLFFWYLRKEKTFFWFALANFLSAFYLSNHFVQNIPVSRHVWEWAFHFSIDGFALCLMFFMHRWLKLKRAALEKYVSIYLFASMAVLFFLPESMMMQGFNINHIVFIGVGTYVSWLLLKTWVQKKNHWLLFPLAALLLDVLFSIHDWQKLINGTANNDHYLMPLGEPLMLFVVGAFLVHHFVQLHKRSDQFALELQKKVIQTTIALQEKHNEVKALEDKQLIKNERERILQELHDGMGGQLISAITLVDKGQDKLALKQILQDALLDLRMVIDSLDEDTRDLSSLLGMLRMRLTPQLKAHGVQLLWDVNPAVKTEGLSYEASLNTLRIVQEAITNALRHAQAKKIQLRLDLCQRSNGMMIEVSDDGCGIKQGIAGRGMGHMQERSKRIGAELEILSSDQGTRIIICLPGNV